MTDGSGSATLKRLSNAGDRVGCRGSRSRANGSGELHETGAKAMRR